jgi:hypothetical protein
MFNIGAPIRVGKKWIYIPLHRFSNRVFGPKPIPISPKATIHTIQHVVNGRFVDAHERKKDDYGLVTRPAQHNDSQKWMIDPSLDL